MSESSVWNGSEDSNKFDVGSMQNGTLLVIRGIQQLVSGDPPTHGGTVPWYLSCLYSCNMFITLAGTHPLVKTLRQK